MSRKGKQKKKKSQREKEGKQVHDKYPSDTGTVRKTQGSLSDRETFFQKFGSEAGSQFVKPCPNAFERSAEVSSVPFPGCGRIKVDFSTLVAKKPKADSSPGYSREDEQAMADALADRTPEGAIIPLAYEGRMQRAKIPVFDDPPPGQLFNPLVAPADFAEGRTPGDLRYVDGYVTAERGEIRLADNMKAYSAEHHDGYLENGTPYAWIDGKAVYAKVRYYYAKLNTTLPLSEIQMAVHLGDAGLISITYETRNGTQKKLYSRKSSLPSRKRMQVIDLERAMAYIEENGIT